MRGREGEGRRERGRRERGRRERGERERLEGGGKHDQETSANKISLSI